MLHIFGSLAEFERELICERTKAGLESARARGRKGGRPPAMDKKKLPLASKMMKDPSISITEMCEAVGKPTLYRYVGRDGTIRKR